MYLNKYDIIKNLGKGSFGSVYLVQNQSHEQFAMKLISLQQNNEPYLRAFFQEELKCLKQIDSPHVVRLMEHHEDEKWIYFIMEYCEGGDLLVQQSQQKDLVFPLGKAASIVAAVIRGLEDLHQLGYLHRDIKSQNVLVKLEDGREVIKLADFGLSKKKQNVTGTVLGTSEYMSPELLRGHRYGFEVDMWGLGVLFYFMLNAEPPFSLNSGWPAERKAYELQKMAKQFSFREAVGRSKKRRWENCTPELQDLFSRIFQVDTEKRINFYDIRSHPVFAKMFDLQEQTSSFSQISPSQISLQLELPSQLLQLQGSAQNGPNSSAYNGPKSSGLNRDNSSGLNRANSSAYNGSNSSGLNGANGSAYNGANGSAYNGPNSSAYNEANSSAYNEANSSTYNGADQDATPELSRTYIEPTDFDNELKLLQTRKDEIDVLKQNYETFANCCGSALQEEEKLMLCYNLLKYYIILLRQLRSSLSCKSLALEYPKFQWEEFLQSSCFLRFRQEVESDLQYSLIKYNITYHQCKVMIGQILQLNPSFGESFSYDVEVAHFVDPFKASYRSTTSYVYKALRKKYDKRTKGNKVGFLLTLVVISHAYNRLFQDRSILKTVFKDFAHHGEQLQFGKLRQRLSTSKNSLLAHIIKDIITYLF